MFWKNLALALLVTAPFMPAGAARAGELKAPYVELKECDSVSDAAKLPSGVEHIENWKDKDGKLRMKRVRFVDMHQSEYRYDEYGRILWVETYQWNLDASIHSISRTWMKKGTEEPETKVLETFNDANLLLQTSNRLPKGGTVVRKLYRSGTMEVQAGEYRQTWRYSKASKKFELEKVVGYHAVYVNAGTSFQIHMKNGRPDRVTGHHWKVGKFDESFADFFAENPCPPEYLKDFDGGEDPSVEVVKSEAAQRLAK